MKNLEEIKDFLINDLSDNDIFEMWNEYAQKNYYDEIYSIDDFDDIMEETSPTDIANSIYFGEYNPNDNYFQFDGYGNIKTTNNIEEFADYGELAEYICDNDDDLGNSELRDFLDEEDEESEED